MRVLNVFVIVLITCTISITISKVVDVPATNINAIVETKHVLEHDNLLLVCNTTTLPGIDGFHWIRNDTSGRDSALYSTGWKLEFINILRKDAATYICHGIENRTGDNVTLTAFKADVQYPTEIDEMAIGPRVITENDTFAVSCSCHGNPEPTWSIFNQETGLAVMTATASADVYLAGVYVQCGDSGRYVCSGFNRLNHGVNVTKGYNITVQCPPRASPCVNYPCNVYSVNIGGNVTMVVNNTADPVPSYEWSRADNKAMNDVIIEKHPRSTSLTILDVGIEDLGIYKVKMVNTFGSLDVNVTLKTDAPPEKPYNLRVSRISYYSANLTWTSGFDMGTPQKFYAAKCIGNEFIQISSVIDKPYSHGGLGQQWTVEATGLDSDVQYMVTIVAENTHGVAFSEPKNFTTLAYPKHHHHHNIRWRYILVILVCSALGCVGGLVLLFVYRKKRSYKIEDKKGLLSKSIAEYGGTVVVNDAKKTKL